MKSSFLMIVCLCLVGFLGNICYSAEKMSYFISYNFIFQENTTTIRVFCQNSEKVRIEMENFFEKEKNGIKSNDLAASTTIYNLKKNISLVLNNHKKVAYERQISEKEVFFIKNYTGETNVSQLTKIGEDIILGYNCDVFVYEGKNKIKYWLAKDLNLILKIEQGEGKFKTITVAKEFKSEEISDSLFEIPNNYRTVQTIISNEEDLKKEPPITLANIEELLFENIKFINILISEDKKFRELTKEEIEIFRLAIKNGSELKESEKKDVNIDSVNRIVFDLRWIGNRGGNIWYDKESRLLFVAKTDVHSKDWEKHEFDLKWIEKYIIGFYIFKPSQEIQKILY